MKTLKKTISNLPIDMNGFTIIELMIVIVIIGILASIAGLNYIPFRKQAYDTLALSDTRNFIDSVIDATLSEELVIYDNDFAGGAIGDEDSDNNPRTPVFILSSGVEAKITQASVNPLEFAALIYHINGTADPATVSGRKEYVCNFDEAAGVVSLP